ncbi:MAG: hypothetical protein REI64_08485 [Pedobacter sp.]|uniref:hypothetical protein n=1 Tax=Pedobacter sp. TaxID=1411316 RepID=UPI0028070219|nr:hypothetical protein [Pedobacter sp.]MDQ8004820.1 hypothetical protein [Pedobacter sp.]
MKKLKINLFGESFIIKKLTPNIFLKEQLAEIATTNNISFNEVIQSPPLIDDIAKCDCEIIIQGLLNTYKNQIEVWFGGKKILKLKMPNLNANNLLFPLYKCEVNEFSLSFLQPAFYNQRAEIGLIACYEISLESFNIDDLIFQISNLENKMLLTGIKYKDCVLFSLKTDTLIVQNFYFRKFTDLNNNFIP